jgi:hypothetical protein
MYFLEKIQNPQILFSPKSSILDENQAVLHNKKLKREIKFTPSFLWLSIFYEMQPMVKYDDEYFGHECYFVTIGIL